MQFLKSFFWKSLWQIFVRSNFSKFLLALWEIMVYTSPCCDMIAMKREVATDMVGFSVERMSRGRRSAISAGKPDGKSLYRNMISASEQINV